MDFFHKLLNFYNLDEEGYAALSAPFSFDDIPDISSYECVQKAIERLKLARERNERVLVYGDYDCDGIMSASIMKLALTQFGVKAEAYLPSRYLDGYGFNVPNAEKIVKSYQLVLTVDNGVTANDAIDVAYKNNVDVIVLDHHSYEKEPEHIVSLVHPLTVGLSSPSISAGFLSYLFAVALLKKHDPYLEMLGATSLISDAMDITSYNHRAVGLALKLWEEYGNPAFSKLAKSDQINETVLSIQIIPAINSIGRMNIGTKINRLIKYFTDPESDDAILLANWMLDINKQRKELIADTASSILIPENKKAVVLQSPLPEGINGLLANKIMDKVNCPVAIYSPSERLENVVVGSMRSKEGCPLTEFMSLVKPLLLTGGGHAYAAGFSLKKEDVSAFEKLLSEYSSTRPFVNEEKETIELSIDEISLENYEILHSFGPFGQGHRAPLFKISFMADRLYFSPDGTRLQTYISSQARLFSFKFNRNNIPSTGELSIFFEMNENVWRGRRTISADVIDIKY